jgi:hypothetical protein
LMEAVPEQFSEVCADAGVVSGVWGKFEASDRGVVSMITRFVRHQSAVRLQGAGRIRRAVRVRNAGEDWQGRRGFGTQG